MAFAGYPMGIRTLRGVVGLRQESPALHWGLVSDIHKNRLAPTRYGFLLHANTQHGASGSPVFRDDGEVAGMLYMGIPEFYPHGDPEDPNTQWYKVPTALSGCISGKQIAQSAALASAEAAKLTNRPLLSERIASGIFHNVVPGDPIMEPYVPE